MLRPYATLAPARAMLWFTFIESLATILLERGVYFYTHDILRLGERDNLLLATAFGVAYVVGALASHAAALRLGERRLLLSAQAALFALHVGVAFFPDAATLAVCFPLIGLLQGLKWPVVESFVSAGHRPAELAVVLGRFNVTWASAVPVALIVSGPLIASGAQSSLFVAAAAGNVLGFGLAALQPAVPEHLDDAHPERPTEGEVLRFGALLAAARWSMLLSYALLFLLAPLLPQVLDHLALGVSAATQVAAMLDVARVATFWALGRFLGWRGRALPIVISIAALPLSFVLILFGGNVAAIVLGELAFGVCSGLLYTAALYYAQLVKNASVEAGGAHEGLIGVGFALGPLLGLVAELLERSAGSRPLSVLLSLGPVCAVLSMLALSSLRARRPPSRTSATRGARP
ncbi:MAG: MFS transporter [Myxococcota bacterium]|nr:MFS transporter [Myxococcota bacterium]